MQNNLYTKDSIGLLFAKTNNSTLLNPIATNLQKQILFSLFFLFITNSTFAANSITAGFFTSKVESLVKQLEVVSAQQSFSIEAAPITRVGTDCNKNIPGSGSSTHVILSVLNIPESGTIEDINIKNLDITHTWINDLRVTLTGPDGTSAIVINQICNSEDNMLLNLDDEATIVNFPTCPPTNSGNYKPANPLSIFDGKEVNGDWTLRIEDTYPSEDGGTFNCWALEFETVSAVVAEICNNNIDDDGDGAVDSDDPDCFTCSNGLLLNPAFENDMTDWISKGNSAIQQEVGGNKYLQILGGEGGIGQDVATTPGTAFSISAYGKKNATENGWIGLTFFDAGFNILGANHAIEITSTNFKLYQLSAIAPANAAWVQAYAWKNAGAGSLDVDGYCVEEWIVTSPTCSGDSCAIAPDWGNYIFSIDDSNANTNWLNYDNGGLFLCDNGDGTIGLKGIIVGGQDADWDAPVGTPCGAQDGWLVDFTLSDMQTWSEFQGGYEVETNLCPNAYQNLDYWNLSGTLTGIGCNAGRTIINNHPSMGNRLQIGRGGNQHSCDFGLSTWIAGTEDGNPVLSDIYAHIDSACYVAMRPAVCANFLTNEEFDNGTNDWSLHVDQSTSSSATWNINNTNQLSGTNAAYVNITNASGTSWDIELLQDNQSIVAGQEYQVVFEAKAVGERDMVVAVQQNSGDWDTYGSQLVNLTTEPQIYSFKFIAPVTNTGGIAVIFHVGKSSENIYIDNVRFSEACVAEICDNNIDDDGDGLIDNADSDCSGTVACTACTSNNLFDNPSFETGTWSGSETFVTGVFATNLTNEPSDPLDSWGYNDAKWVESNKATDGNRFVYLNKDTDESVCFSQLYTFGDGNEINDCDTYQVCFDWASFNNDYVNGRATSSQPSIDFIFRDNADQKLKFVSVPLGEATANQNWNNLTWESLSFSFKFEGNLTVPANTSSIKVLISERDDYNNGLLLDNTSFCLINSCSDNCGDIQLDNIVVSDCINHPLMDVATLDVEVSWTDAPPNDSIVVQIANQTAYIAVANGVSSPQIIQFTVPADGSTNNNINVSWKNTSGCAGNSTYNTPTACSNDKISCDILYICGDDKPYDGDAWDHGWLEYLDAVNGDNVLTPAFSKNDANGIGLYDPHNTNNVLAINFRDYDLIIVSATTEGRLSNDIIDSLAITPVSVLNSNINIYNDLGMTASEGGVAWQSNAFVDNTTAVDIYNFNNKITPWNGQVLLTGDYHNNADVYLWEGAGDAASGVEGVLFNYTADDVLPSISNHGNRVFLGYHMNGFYANNSNGGTVPTPSSAWFEPAKHLTLIGKTHFDVALKLASASCNSATNSCPLTNMYPGFPIDFLNDNSGWVDYNLVNDLELIDNGDGTKTISGSINNGTPVDFGSGMNGTSCGSNDGWTMNLTLSDKMDWTTFQAAGGSANVHANCNAQIANLDYWDVSGTLTGTGCNAGRTLTVNGPKAPYRLQIGYGGNNGDAACDFGMSTWFDIEENGTVINADIYAFLEESCYNTTFLNKDVCYLIADGDGDGWMVPDTFYTFNHLTGAVTPIGLTGTMNIEAMALDTVNHIIYTADGNDFGVIDIATAVFTAINTNMGSINGAEGSHNVTDLDGMTYDYTNNIIWATARASGIDGLPDDLLLKIDPATGTPIANSFGAGIDYLTVNTNENDLDDIAVAADGTLYAISNLGSSGNQRLGIINKTTGAWTEIGDYGIEDVESLTFTAKGQLLATTGEDGDHQNSLYSIDASTAEATYVGSILPAQDVEACVCNFGNFIDLQIGDKVWADINADGIQDIGEPGVKDVTVNLLNENGTPYLDATNTPVTSNTDIYGIYNFGGLSPGNYLVEFELPTGTSFSNKDIGGDDTKDSDADAVTGRTGIITLSGSINNRDADAGILNANVVVRDCDDAGELFVVDELGGAILRFNSTTGTLIDTFITGLSTPKEMIVGADNYLYVSDAGLNEVRRYSLITGALIDVLARNLKAPNGMTFDANGMLYVNNKSMDEVLKIDPSNGTIAVFVTEQSGGLDSNNGGIEFGPDGNLYVASRTTDEVLRFNGTTGAFIDVFVSAGSGTLNGPDDLAFGADGRLYVVSSYSDQVKRYNGTTGAYIDDFVTYRSGGLRAPRSLTFGTDNNIYVSGQTSPDGVYRYNELTGAFVDLFATGLADPRGMLFAPVPNCDDCCAQINYANNSLENGDFSSFTSNSNPNGTATLTTFGGSDAVEWNPSGGFGTNGSPITDFGANPGYWIDASTNGGAGSLDGNRFYWLEPRNSAGGSDCLGAVSGGDLLGSFCQGSTVEICGYVAAYDPNNINSGTVNTDFIFEIYTNNGNDPADFVMTPTGTSSINDNGGNNESFTLPLPASTTILDITGASFTGANGQVADWRTLNWQSICFQVTLKEDQSNYSSIVFSMADGSDGMAIDNLSIRDVSTPDAGRDTTLYNCSETIDLNNAQSGEVWSKVSEPIGATASIDANTGIVTGLTENGEYKFLLAKTTLAICQDTIRVLVDCKSEICDNNIDDDGDGLSDCADPDCGQPTVIDIVVTEPNNCPDFDNGQIIINATGDNLEYSINISEAYQNSNVFSNLSAGTYVIRVRNSVTGCVQLYSMGSKPTTQLDNDICSEICNNDIDDDGDGLTDCEDPDCQVANITNLSFSNCVLVGNDFQSTLSVEVEWSNPPAGENLIVGANNTTQTIDIVGGATSPAIVEFTITADNSQNNPITIDYSGGSGCSLNATYNAPAPCPDPTDRNAPCDNSSGHVGGIVFEDLNSDGLQDSGEPGLAGILVTATDSTGSTVGQTITNNIGVFQFETLTNGIKVRLEFTAIPSGMYPTNAAIFKGTTVQFEQVPSCDAALGLIDPTENPCDVILNGSLLNGYALVSTLPGADNITLAVKDLTQLGTLWQTAGNRNTNQAGSVSTFKTWTTADFEGAAIFSTTIDPKKETIYAIASPLHGSAENTESILFETAIAPKVFKIDAETGAVSRIAELSGTLGLGYIDFDAVHEQLFVTNMDDGKIYRLNTDGTILSSFDPLSADDGITGQLPTLGDRVMGVAFNPINKRVYYSVWANHYDRTNVSTNVNATFNTIRSIALDANGAFIPASDQLEITMPYGASGFNLTTPVGDIEFNRAGDKVLLAEIPLGENTATNQITTASYIGVLREYQLTSGTWTMETVYGSNNESKYDMGNQTFYKGRNSRGGAAWAYGSITDNTINGDDSYIVATGDALHITAIEGDNIFGLQFMPSTGANIANSILIDLDNDLTNENLYAYGDIDVYKDYCANLSLEIGNYVWLDEDEDGVQDPNEFGMEGINVTLYNAAGDSLTTVVTNADGEYYFSDINHGLMPNTTYYIVIGRGGQFDITLGVLNEVNNLTTLDLGAGNYADLNDSDGRIATIANGQPAIIENYPFIEVQTGTVGQNDYSLDFGFRQVCSAAFVVNDSLVLCPRTDYEGSVAVNDKNYSDKNFSAITQPTSGTVTMNSDGTFMYTNTTSTCETDEFRYQVCDETNVCCVTAVVHLNFNDTTKPTLANVPENDTISCDELIPLPPQIFARDNCPRISLNVQEESTQGEDGCSLYDYTITRTWTVTDQCGNSTSAAQIVEVQDIVAPDIYRIYNLPNGKKMVAGVMELVGENWKTINLPIDFDTKPVILHQVVTSDANIPVVSQIQNVSVSQFELRIKSEEAHSTKLTRKSIAWIAVEAGAQLTDYQLDVNTLLVSETSQVVNFQNAFAAAPALFVSSQTTDEQDPFTIRQDGVTATGATLNLQEEASNDVELIHTDERIGYLAIEKLGSLREAKGVLIGEVGTVTINSNWATINLNHTYSNPVIIANSLSNIDGEAATVSIRNVGPNQFEMSVNEWAYLNGTHSNETISYIVIEGSIPLESPDYCDTGTDSLDVSVDFKAVDNCDVSVVINYVEKDTFIGATKVITRTWSAEDECGNATAYSQEISCEGVSLQIKSILQGAMLSNDGDGLMRDDLRRKNLLPMEEPYTEINRFQHVASGGGEVITDATILADNGANSIVDWVFLELRAANDVDNVIATKSALIQRDGDVVTIQGDTIIHFTNTRVGDYYVAVRHRNHLGIISLNTFTFSPSEVPMVDFTFTFTPVVGDHSSVEVDNLESLWSGDLNNDGKVIYQGPNNDIFFMFLHVLKDEGNQDFLPNYISRAYTNDDFNLDGSVIYQGPNNDRANLLFNTILKHPDNPNKFSNFIIYSGGN